MENEFAVPVGDESPGTTSEEGFQTFVQNTCSALMDGTKNGYIKIVEVLFAMRDAADEQEQFLSDFEQVIADILSDIRTAMTSC